MIIKLIALILVTILCVSYTLGIYLKVGIRKSISISFYNLPERDRILFRLFIWGLSIGLATAGGTLLFAIAGGFLSLVGIFTKIKIRWKKNIHLIGAITGITMSFIALISLSYTIGIITTGVFLMLSLLYLIFGNKKTIIWFIECFAMITLIVGLTFSLFL